jgi:hypothetical protein
MSRVASHRTVSALYLHYPSCSNPESCEEDHPVNPQADARAQCIHHPMRGPALDLWVDIVSDLIVAEVLGEQQSHRIACGPEHGPEEAQCVATERAGQAATAPMKRTPGMPPAGSTPTASRSS